MYYLGVDPGKDKCGLALLNDQGAVLVQKIVPPNALEKEIEDIASGKDNITIILGNGTTSKKYIKILLERKYKVEVVEESYSTLEARELYFQEKGYGWQAILPKGLRSPNCPLDDYAARILVNRYLMEIIPMSKKTKKNMGKKEKPGS